MRPQGAVLLLRDLLMLTALAVEAAEQAEPKVPERSEVSDSLTQVQPGLAALADAGARPMVLS